MMKMSQAVKAKGFRRLLSLFRQNQDGNILVLAGITMPVLIGLAGLGTDTLQWTLAKQQLQRSADSAALNGAFARAQSENATTNANADLTSTLDGLENVGITIQNAPTAGPFAGNNRAVRVVLTYQKALPFSSLFLSSPPNITVEATASVLNNGDYCLIALDDTNTTGVTFGGNSTVDLGCGVATNATGGSAVVAIGSTSVSASPIAAVGYVPTSNNYATGTELISYSIPQRDPFATLPDPTDSIESPCSGGAVNVSPSQTRTIDPDCYTSIDVKGNLTMRPGIYYINGGDFTTNSQATLTAIGVTIVMTGHGTNIGQVDMNGGANITMSAPTDGVYNGVLFYKDRDAPSTFIDVFNGGASGSFGGAIYMPSQTVRLNGNSNFTTDCLKLVSRLVEITGNTVISNTNCPPDPNPGFRGTQVRLVG